MKTLSVRNPYAYLLAYGVKDVENRTWSTDYRGPLLIHCSGDDLIYPPLPYLPNKIAEEVTSFVGKPLEGASVYTRRFADLCASCLNYLGLPHYTAQNVLDTAVTKAANIMGAPMRAQAIVGKVDLVDVVKDAQSPFAEKGQYHWLVSNPVVFGPPVAGVKGKLRLWDYELPSQVKQFNMSTGKP